MRTKYIDLISQTYEFPQEEFKVEDNELIFNTVPPEGGSMWLSQSQIIRAIITIAIVQKALILSLCCPKC